MPDYAIFTTISLVTIVVGVGIIITSRKVKKLQSEFWFWVAVGCITISLVTGFVAFKTWWPATHPQADITEYNGVKSFEVVDENTVIINGDTFVKQQ